MKEYPNVTIFDHPLIRHKIALLRDEKTNTKQFRELVEEITTLMTYESLRDVPLKQIMVKTPLETVEQWVVSENAVTIVPILRAGLGMVNGVHQLFPMAKVGHIGLYRDETTFEPNEYYCKLPETITQSIAILLDPMLATGGSAEAAIGFIKQRGCKSIKLMSILGVQEGIDRVHRSHPDVHIYVGCKDEKLNEIGYIVPGLGDAGDRIFGTK